jgi:hypothetical protein
MEMIIIRIDYDELIAEMWPNDDWVFTGWVLKTGWLLAL